MYYRRVFECMSGRVCVIRVSEETHESLVDLTIRKESFDETIQRLIKTQYVIDENGRPE